MGKGKNRNRSSGRGPEDRYVSAPRNTILSPFDPLKLLEDRRLQLGPDLMRPALTFAGYKGSITATPPQKQRSRFRALKFPSQLSFHAPTQVIVCAKRKIRREVLHALKKTRGYGRKKPHRNALSNIRCR